MSSNIEGQDNFLTHRDLKEKLDVPFKASDFVPERDPHKLIFVPAPEVPDHLFSKDDARKIRLALQRCTDVVGVWGNYESRKGTPEFIEAANSFKGLTGVEVWDVINLARERFFNWDRS